MQRQRKRTGCDVRSGCRPTVAVLADARLARNLPLVQSLWMRTAQRTEVGRLVRHHIWLFLQTDAGHHWRLDVDERRVAGLIGLRVEVKGAMKDGALAVEGIVRS